MVSIPQLVANGAAVLLRWSPAMDPQPHSPLVSSPRQRCASIAQRTATLHEPEQNCPAQPRRPTDLEYSYLLALFCQAQIPIWFADYRKRALYLHAVASANLPRGAWAWWMPMNLSQRLSAEVQPWPRHALVTRSAVSFADGALRDGVQARLPFSLHQILRLRSAALA